MLIEVFTVVLVRDYSSKLIKMSDLGELNQKYFRAYKNLHPTMLSQKCQKECDSSWRQAKKDYPDKARFRAFILEKIEEWQKKTTEKKAGLLNYYAKVSCIEPYLFALNNVSYYVA